MDLSKEEFKRVFAARVKKAREDSDLTQEEVADRVGAHKNTISEWERPKAKTFPSSDMLARLCKELEVSADHLLGVGSSFQQYANEHLRWYISRPPAGSPLATQDIEDGCGLFNKIMEGKGFEDVEKIESFTGRSPEALSRLLRRIFISKVVQIYYVKTHAEKERQLRERYQLKQCFVADLTHLPSDPLIDKSIRTETIAVLAAQKVKDILDGVESVGITGGSIMSRLCDHIPPATLSGKTWIALLQESPGHLPVGAHANGVVSRMVFTQPATTGYRIPFINYHRRKKHFETREGNSRDHDRHETHLEAMATKKYDDEELRDAAFVHNLAQRVGVAIMSVGAIETNILTSVDQPAIRPLIDVLEGLSPADRARCKGDILRRLVDGDGNRVGNDEEQEANDAFVYSISLEDLKAIAERGRVYIVAGRKQKADVVRGALNAGIANCLVVENTVADALLE